MKLPIHHILRSFLAYMLVAAILPSPAKAENFVTGFCVNSQRPPADREAVLDQLQSAGVHVIRTAFPGRNPGDFNFDFAKRAYDKGIKIILLVSPAYSIDVPGRKPLSAADPELSKAYFASLLGRLESKGVVLEGLELGNEINWSGYNADFPVPGKGVLLELDDLYHDAEGQQIAKGFLQYLKVLAVLKEARDRSQLNCHTPIISAGLSDFNHDWPTPDMHLDSVSLHATLSFLRANGLDSLVDAYAIHRYPKDKTPEARKIRLNQACSLCRSANSNNGKPCWITEWGVNNSDRSCPVDDSARTAVVQETMNNYRDLAKQGRLIGAIYYRWDSYPASQFDPSSVYRCGTLTDSGKLVLKP